MFSQITIVTVDGRPGDSFGAQLAIQRSAQQLPGAHKLLISAQKPEKLLEGIVHKTVQKLDYYEYSLFVLYGLHALIDTPFALIVQDDGWVLDGSKWSDAFWLYDYIGAPIHAAVITHNGQRTHLRGFEWTRHLADPNVKIDFVQNGGFSLRSRRFLKMLSEHQIAFEHSAPQLQLDASGTTRLFWPMDDRNDDVFSCVRARSTLEQLGIRFAPLEVCRCFAYEHLGPGVNDNLDLTSILGHHSKLRKIVSCEPYTIQYVLTQSEAQAIWGESRIIDALVAQGARVLFKQ